MLIAAVVSHDVEGKDEVRGGQPYVVYSLAVSEAGDRWSVQRRWNDLRIMVATLQAKHAKQLRDSGVAIPRFNVHGFRSAGAMLEPSFRDERAAAMQGLLAAYLKALPASVVRGEGPEPLLDFLSPAQPRAGLSAALVPPSLRHWSIFGSTSSTLSVDLPEEPPPPFPMPAIDEHGETGAPSPKKHAAQRSPVKARLSSRRSGWARRHRDATEMAPRPLTPSPATHPTFCRCGVAT